MSFLRVASPKVSDTCITRESAAVAGMSAPGVQEEATGSRHRAVGFISDLAIWLHDSLYLHVRRGQGLGETGASDSISSPWSARSMISKISYSMK